MSRPVGVFCPNCGTRNLATAQACRSCGELLPTREDRPRFQRRSPASNDPALQETQAIPVRPPAAPPSSSPPPAPPPPVTPVTPAPKAAPAQPHYPSPPPEAVRPLPTPSRARTLPGVQRGPHGCLLGIIALVLICLAAGSLVWLVGRPLLTTAVEREIDRTVATQVAGIERIPLESTGEIVITEEEINRNLQDYEGSLDPVEDLEVEVVADEVRVRFRLYGSTSTYRGNLDVRGNRLVVVDEHIDGPAGRVLDAGGLATILEDEVAALLDRFDLEPVDVRVRDGAIRIETRPA